MPKTLIKSRLRTNKHKPKIRQEVNNAKSNLPPHLQSFKQKLLSGNGFDKYGSRLLENLSQQGANYTIQIKILNNLAVSFYFINELRRFSNNR